MIPVVHVVDDDDIIRAEISKALQLAGFRTVESATAEHFLNVFEPEQRGCIIIDERMPGGSGSAALEVIARWLPIYPALLITGYADIPLAVSVMKCGAFDIIQKPFVMESLLKRVNDAISWNEKVWTQYAADARVWSDLQTLTAREVEILGLIIEGKSSKTIGSQLKISARTVDNHRVHILSKMRAKSLSDLGRAVARANALFADPGIAAIIKQLHKC